MVAPKALPNFPNWCWKILELMLAFARRVIFLFHRPIPVTSCEFTAHTGPLVSVSSTGREVPVRLYNNHPCRTMSMWFSLLTSISSIFHRDFQLSWWILVEAAGWILVQSSGFLPDKGCPQEQPDGDQHICWFAALRKVNEWMVFSSLLGW